MKMPGIMTHLTKSFFCNLFICVMVIMLGSFPAAASPKGSPWGADYFPNVELVNQDGKTVHFYDDLIKDKVVVVNFIYTHCGDTCPAQTATLTKVYKLLADRMGKDIFFYSISIDPKQDNPKALKEYAASFNIDTSNGGWQFLIGKKEDTILLRKKLGLFRDGVGADKLSEHNTSFVVGSDKSGRWMKRSAFDEPKVLAWLLGSSLSDFKGGRREGMISYTEAQQIPKMSKGEELFNTRCDSCHSLGVEEGVGPGLLNVTEKRDRKWLARWLKTPDKLLAEKDPIAIALLNQYKKVLMPNFRLTDSDVEALIKYMEETSKEINSKAKK